MRALACGFRGAPSSARQPDPCCKERAWLGRGIQLQSREGVGPLFFPRVSHHAAPPVPHAERRLPNVLRAPHAVVDRVVRPVPDAQGMPRLPEARRRNAGTALPAVPGRVPAHPHARRPSRPAAPRAGGRGKPPRYGFERLPPDRRLPAVGELFWRLDRRSLLGRGSDGHVLAVPAAVWLPAGPGAGSAPGSGRGNGPTAGPAATSQCPGGPPLRGSGGAAGSATPRDVGPLGQAGARFAFTYGRRSTSLDPRPPFANEPP